MYERGHHLYVALKIFRRGTKTQGYSDTIVCEFIWNTCWPKL